MANASFIDRLPARTAWAWNVLPLDMSADGRFRVGIAAPHDADLQTNLSVLLDAPVEAVPMAADDIRKGLLAVYGVGASELDGLTNGDHAVAAGGSADDSSIARFVTGLIDRAHGEGATDIHIEPDEDGAVVRFRVDGLLTVVPTPASLLRHLPALVSRIKVMAGMNIAEKRLPQDGRFRARSAGNDIDVRVSTVPTVHGETVDLRLLPKGRLALGLEDLGMAPDILADVARLIQRPNGILLVTGPTGHGKTTTLYAALSRINTPERKIITIEDPVEYHLRGVNQIQVHPKIGLTFASGLRAVLRQDPDVLMIGEIRDVDTAEISIRSSLTGHLVFSTLHTNDAVAAVARLTDMGVEPYLVASSVNAVLGQRLVRQTCAACRGGGCGDCRGTGFRGRTGLFELFTLNDDLRALIVAKAPASDVRRRAVALGMRTLFADGQRKAEAGVTTLNEVRRVTEEF